MLVNIELLNVSSWEQLTISTQTAHWDLLHLRMNHEMNLKFFFENGEIWPVGLEQWIIK